MTGDAALLAALAVIRERGAIGESDLASAVDHSRQFVRALPEGARTLADLGSGGGLPGLVIAADRPQIAVTLIERRQSRADLLRRAARSLELDNVMVRAGDVREVASVSSSSFDVVTARSFAAPADTARWAAALLRPGGTALVSEPPDGDAAVGRWPQTVLAPAGLVDRGRHGAVRVLCRL